MAVEHDAPAAVVSSEPEITIEKFVLPLGALGEAFRVTEKLAHKQTRKMTRSAWLAEYGVWKNKPRG